MTIPLKINNHPERAYELLLGQFKDKPVIAAVLQTWIDMYQEVENDLYSLMTETLFLNARGDNLERYGQLLGIAFPEGMPARDFRELLISEILKRSSDGTPDRIRQILEATTGIHNTRIFEHFNGNQNPWIMGCNFVYGYSDLTNPFTVSIDTDEGKYLAMASPITTGSCILGLHKFNPSSLFIPAEISQPLEKLGLSSNKTTNPTFDIDLSGWTFSSDKISWDETFADAEHPDGRLKVDVAGVAEAPEFSQFVEGLDETHLYRFKVNQYNEQGYSSTVNFTANNRWVPDLNISASVNKAIQIPLVETTGPTEISFNLVWDGGVGDYFLFDGINTHEDSFHAVISEGILYVKQSKVPDTFILVNGVPVDDGTYLVPLHTNLLIQLSISSGIAIDTIGNSTGLTGGFSGNITNFTITNEVSNTILRKYPCILSGDTAPVETIIVDTVGGVNGTLVNTTQWETIKYSETLVGNSSSYMVLADVVSGDILIKANTNLATDALMYFDQIEIYDEDTYNDQDELVNETDDWVGVSGTYLELHPEGFQNAILPELGSSLDRFFVETTRELEPFLVDVPDDPTMPIDTFQIEQVFEDRPENTHGVMLEISQTLLTETLQ